MNDIILIIAGLLLLPIALATLRRYRRTPPTHFRDRFFGDALYTEARVEHGVYQIGIGSLTLDLSRSEVPDGESVIVLSGIAGALRLIAPKGAAISVDANTIVGNVYLPGRRIVGILRRAIYTTSDYETHTKRLRIEANLAYGSIFIHLP